MEITLLQPFNLDTTGNYTFTTVTSNIKTDNLMYANGSPYVFSGEPGGSNTQIQFNDGGSFSGNSNFTFDKTTSILTVTGNITTLNANLGNAASANFFIGNGSLLTGLPASYSDANVAAYLPTYTGNISANNITVANSITAPSITTSGSGGNLSGANYVIANFFSGNGSALSSIAGANVTGQVANALVAGSVFTNAQPNVTSVGTLTSLSVSGNATTGNANLGNAASANFFIGNGSLLTGLPAGYSNADVANYLPTYTGNISANNITVSNSITAPSITTSGSGGNLSGANYVIANFFSGNGSELSSLAGANVTGQVANALVAGTVYTNEQPNITSVGTLTSVSVSGNSNVDNIFGTSINLVNDATIGGNLQVGDAIITGNLTVNGTTIYANVTTLNVKDPIIEQGGTGNDSPLSSNDGKDRGSLLHYYTTAPIDAFMGWDNSNAEFAFGSNVSVSGEVVTFNELGNIRAGNATFGNAVTANFFVGNGSLLTGLPKNDSILNGNSNVTVNANSNVTISVSGNANIATFTATGVNVAGYTTVAGDLTLGAKSNLGPIGNVTITGGTANYVLKTDGVGNLSWTPQPAVSNVAGTTDTFTGTGSQTAFTLSVTPTDENLTFVNIDGVLQLRSSYSLTGEIITFSSAPLSGTTIEISSLSGTTGGGTTGGITTGKAIAMSIVFGG